MALNPLLEEACNLKIFYVLILLAICGGNVLAPAASASIAHQKAGRHFPRICTGTPNPALCAHILSGTPASTPLNRQIAIITTYALRVSKTAYRAIGKDAESFRKLRKKPMAAEEADGKLAEGAILDCLDLMGNSMDQLRTTIGKVSSLGSRTRLRAARTQLMDARVSLSASLTFQNTCQDELSQHPGAAGAKFVLREGQLITGSLELALSLADTLQGKLHP